MASESTEEPSEVCTSGDAIYENLQYSRTFGVRHWMIGISLSVVPGAEVPVHVED